MILGASLEQRHAGSQVSLLHFHLHQRNSGSYVGKSCRNLLNELETLLQGESIGQIGLIWTEVDDRLGSTQPQKGLFVTKPQQELQTALKIKLLGWRTVEFFAE